MRASRVKPFAHLEQDMAPNLQQGTNGSSEESHEYLTYVKWYGARDGRETRCSAVCRGAVESAQDLWLACTVSSVQLHTSTGTYVAAYG